MPCTLRKGIIEPGMPASFEAVACAEERLAWRSGGCSSGPLRRQATIAGGLVYALVTASPSPGWVEEAPQNTTHTAAMGQNSSYRARSDNLRVGNPRWAIRHCYILDQDTNINAVHGTSELRVPISIWPR